ncbi:MAG TPA: ABC transporter permease [Gemmatimonadales bacterium]|nr:ABC transporter permease [Gemmatimonadales bacterium]
MSFIDGLRYRMHALFGREQFEREMKEEFAHHLALEAAQQPAGDGTERAFAARRRLGNQARLEEQRREAAGIGFFDILVQDLRFAFRSFARTPGFTAITILVLAIGIGANTAIFSAVNTMLLRPLPFPAPDQLMKVSLTIPSDGTNPPANDVVWSVPKFEFLRAAQTVFEDQGLVTEVEFTIRGLEEPIREFGEITDGHYFGTLGVKPLLGREFDASEAGLNGPRSILISHAYWQRHFNADPQVLGKTLNVQREPRTIIGVMPHGFRGMSGRAELWMPIAQLWGEGMNEVLSHAFTGVARRKPGVGVAQAVAAVHALGPRIDAAARPGITGAAWGAVARPLDATRVDPVIRRSLVVLVAAVGLVLLIVIANVANLFLIRATGRQQEIAVRLAIGAGRGRVVRQLLTESTLLSLVGGVCGVAVAWWGVRLLSTLDPASALRGREVGGIGAVNFGDIALDWTALAFALGITIVAGICFGLVPALKSTRAGLGEELKRGVVPRWRGMNSRNLLVVGEIALALVLLTGAGLVIRSMGRMLDVRTGIEPGRMLTLRMNLEGSRDSLAFGFDQILQRLSALPGVESVAIGDCLPLSGGCNGTSLTPRDRPAGEGLRTGVHWISPGWIATMGVPLVRGRGFTDADRAGVQRVVLINEAAAKAYWPGQDPIGRGVSVGQGGFHADTARIVGIVGDVKYESIDGVPGPDVYLPIYQSPRPWLIVQVKTKGDPVALAAPARRVLQEINPASPIYDIRTMESRVRDSMAYARFSALLLGAFAAVALVLATMGTYGVISFGVSQRTRELGIRSALGATRGDMIRLVARQGMTMALIGGTIGLAGALAFSRMLGSMLYGVPPVDPPTYGVVIGVMLTAVAAASLVPARRAAAVPPADALRRGQ